MANCAELGRCSHPHIIRDKYIYEDKTYSPEEAAMLLTDTFAQTQILSHQNLDGEVQVGDEDIQGRYVNFIENVPAGTLRRLYRDRIVSNGWYSQATGYGIDVCGFVGGSTKRKVEVDTYICTTLIRQEEEVCMDEFLGTWKQSGLAPGALNKGQDIFISEQIYYAMERENYESIDRHFWHGDYGHADENIAHLDGIIKQLVSAFNSELPEIWQFDITGLASGMTIKGWIGGTLFEIPFNTDADTTVADFRAAIASWLDYQGNALFPVVGGTGTTITVQTQPGVHINQFSFLVTDDVANVERCLDGTASYADKCEKPEGVLVESTLISAAEGGNCPIGIPLENVTPGNAIDKVTELYSAIQAAKPELLAEGFGGTLFVAKNVAVALKLALKMETATYLGSAGPLDRLAGLCGFDRIVQANYLNRNEMYFFRPEDVHVATDLISDVREINQGYDPRCGLAWFKHAFALGFKVSEPCNVAGTLCNRPENEFGPDMPCPGAAGIVPAKG